MFQLASGNKYITVTKCNGGPMVRIFHPLDKSKDQIVLSVSEWNALKHIIDEVDTLFLKENTGLDIIKRENKWPGLTQPEHSVFSGVVPLRD